MSRTAWLGLALFLALSMFGGCGGGRREEAAQSTPVASGGESGPEEPSSADGVPARLPSNVMPTRYALTMGIVPDQTRFTGMAEIDVRLPERQRSIWIHGQGLDVSRVVVTESGRDPIEATWEQVDASGGIARINFARPVGPGAIRLQLNWSAAFDESLEGLYRVHVSDENYAFTQFEPLAARKVFPSFDEPSFKTPFDVTIVAPSAVRAFANTREESSNDLPNGMRSVRFATTEPLPTYLIAFAVGNFDVVEATIPPNAVRTQPLPLRGIAVHGRGAELAYAMEHTPRIVASLEEWFGTPYPFDKLDIVAVPEFSAGAMENAGLVTFRDVLLLLSPDAPVRQRRGFAFVMAHELAHQWFGNLVTMSWWDDLWLNEAFATWMETHIVGDVFPEMHADVEALMTALDAFDADSYATARRIRNPIASTHDIHNAFDSITYSKGASVLAMFERWLGQETFQLGIRRYLREHAGRNATAEDLMAALGAEAQRDVRAPLETFLLQPGVPIVDTRVECGSGSARLAFAQHRFLPVGSSAQAGATWQLPICARYASGGQVHETCTLLTAAEGTMDLEGGACPDWVLPNADGVGYYRFTLEDAWLAKLRQRDTLRTLSVRDRIAIADSVRAGFASGRVLFAQAMAALEPFASSEDRFVATAPIEILRFAEENLLSTDAEREAFQEYASRLYRPQVRRLGWGPRPRVTEDGEQRLLRAEILSFLALDARDRTVREEAEARGRAWTGEGARDRPGEIHPNAVTSDLVGTVLSVTAQQGGPQFFSTLDRLLGGTQDSVVRGHLIGAMGRVDDAPLRPRALALALDPRLRINELITPVREQLADRDGRDAAWTWLRENYDVIAQRVGPGFAGYLPFTAASFCSVEKAEEARAFFGPRMESTQGGPRNLESAIESIQLCVARANAQRDSARAFFAQEAARP